MKVGGAHSAHLHNPQNCQLRQTWLPFRLCLSYIQCPSYSPPISVHPPDGNICNGCRLTITAHAAYTLEVTWKHIKVSPCMYNSRVHYICCLVKYIFRALCDPRCLDHFIHVVRIMDWTGRSTMCLIKKTLLPPSSTVSTSSQCLLHPPLPH